MANKVLSLIPQLWFKFGLVRLWRLVPRPLRRRIVARLIPLPKRAGRRLAAPQAPVMMCGFLASPLGLGWSARLTRGLVEEAGVPIRDFDIGHAFATGERDAVLPDASGPATVIFNFNPGQFGYALQFLPDDILRDKYIIGYCVWELERIPDDWLTPLTLVDELWVPTHFVRQAFENAGVKLPIRVVPHIMSAPAGLARDRARFGWPEDAFVATVVASLRSSLARKNPLAAVDAFRRAFPGGENALLVLKLGDSHLEAEALATVRAAIGDDPRIRLLLDTLDNDDMWTLLASSDAVVSLHRAEGFGLVPAQAMLAGRPVVATGWSGNLDFMSEETACLVPYRQIPVEDPSELYVAPDLHWADPDIGQAAAFLRRLHDDPAEREALGQRARQGIETYFRNAHAPIVAAIREWPHATKS
ncbi:glycosyltransferase involved in cell wall biosynthesis [Pseudochelatococcus lubricantis]|uniref:Glycosyltransferase involved in cell wall biosynthesis n=1 Tax=Pseudochelatococcus lubricantis TaxID=1538102 RepID=A0ABX0UZL9_9HYPH|nr:glycosyltransferase family 4 protein [Pseudochelatococcus lubricantis]NIJ57025.1 glycosyltransferase involved in cell wall biosynthesis [Pseudochelatococcus lubricantis]